MYNRIAQIEIIKNLVKDNNEDRLSQTIKAHNLCSVCKSSLIAYLEESYDAVQSQTRSYLSAIHNNQMNNFDNNDNNNNQMNNYDNDNHDDENTSIKDELLNEIKVLESKLIDLDHAYNIINHDINNYVVSESKLQNALYQEILLETKLDRLHQQLQCEQYDLLALAYTTNDEIHKLHSLILEK